jgi:hypothetical protein
MAGLQCPTCGYVHALDDIGPEPTFRCRGCDRMLSVPPMPGRPGFPEAETAAHRPVESGAGDDDGGPPTGFWPAPSRGETGPVAAPARQAPQVPPKIRPERTVSRVVRALVWMVAFPIGFLVVVLPLRAIGLLDVNRAIDIFAGASIARFAVLLLMLPLWAAVSATLAHFSLEALGRGRGRRLRPPDRAAPEPAIVDRRSVR